MAHLEVEQIGHVLVLTMNRPEARNALSPDMIVGLADAWDQIDSDPSIRCAVLTGAGGTFCSGADLKMMNESGTTSAAAERMKEDSGLHWKALLRSHQLTKPLIAAVEGFALAGGTEILQATDIRVAAESAVFGVTEVTRGLFPLGGSTVRLRRQIGYTKAMEMLLIGERVSATEAERIGLIGRVVPDGEALKAALEIAEKIAANAPLSVQAVKKAVQASEGLTEAEGLAKELEIGVAIFGTNDAKEGTLAFKEKRPPVYTGT
jgi:enoyl-CoA hydratase